MSTYNLRSSITRVHPAGILAQPTAQDRQVLLAHNAKVAHRKWLEAKAREEEQQEEELASVLLWNLALKQ